MRVDDGKLLLSLENGPKWFSDAGKRVLWHSKHEFGIVDDDGKLSRRKRAPYETARPEEIPDLAFAYSARRKAFEAIDRPSLAVCSVDGLLFPRDVCSLPKAN